MKPTARLTVLVVAALAVGGLSAARAAVDIPGPAGVITSVAGTDVSSRQYGFSGDGGPATAAQIYHPRAITFDGAGKAYFADTLNSRIRRIDTNGQIATIAGNGTMGFSGDGGPALSAALNQPHGLAIDSGGNLYIADSSNDRIRRVDRRGIITTVAGNGTPGAEGDGGPARSAQVKDPKTLATDSTRTKLYIADAGNNRIRVIDLRDGTINTVAGVTAAGAEGDGGQANKARLNSPRGIAISGNGTVYIADTDNHRVRRITPDGTINTIAGTGVPGYSGDGGPAPSAQLNDPRAVAVDANGNLFIGEETGARIRRVDRNGRIVTIAGDSVAGYRGDGGQAANARLDHLRALTLDSRGNLWIADTFSNRVRVIAAAASAPVGRTTMGEAPATPPTAQGGNVGPALPKRTGYWMVTSDGRVYAFGDAKHLGDPAEALAAGEVKAVALEPTPSGGGYWILDSKGGVFAFGDAVAPGSVAPAQLKTGEKPTSISATPSGKGYWVFTNRGRVIAFGDAGLFGDLGGTSLNGPVLDSVPTPSGKGYYMVASDGGVFAFGDAVFYGSMGSTRLNAPVESLVPNGDGKGYWLVAGDGGIFAFGTAPFRGSMGSTPLAKPVVGMVRYGNGYLMVGGDGGIFNFSDRPFSGSLGDNPPDNPVIGVGTLEVF